jgi:hypothetical protein
MRNWKALVEGRLAGLTLEPEERAEVIAEVAAHLEEVFDGLLRQGVTEDEAVRRTLSRAGSWRDLRRKIQAARKEKNVMTNQVRQFWLPGLVTLVLSGGALSLIENFSPRSWILALRGVLPVGMLYVPWLLMLPVIGAFGAYLSHRAGGSRRTVISSIVFPVLPFLASALLVFPGSLFSDHFMAHMLGPMSLVMALLGWVLVPGVALLVGGLPTELLVSRRQASRRITMV